MQYLHDYSPKEHSGGVPPSMGFPPSMGPWAGGSRATLSPSRTCPSTALCVTTVSAALAPLALTSAPAWLSTVPNCSHLPLDSVTEEQSCPGEQGTGQRGEDTLFPSLLFFPLRYVIPVNLGLVRCVASVIYGTRGISSHSWQRLDLAAPWHLPQAGAGPGTGSGRRDWILLGHPLCPGGNEASDHQIHIFS